MTAVDGRIRALVVAAQAWCVLFAAVHLFWAFGGSAGLASSAGRELAERRPTWFVVLGLYGVGILCAFGAVLVRMAVASTDLLRRRVAGRLVAVAGVALLARGVLLEVVLAAGVGGVRAQVGEVETFWSLVLWNPWFVLGGGLLVCVALSARRPRLRRSG